MTDDALAALRHELELVRRDLTYTQRELAYTRGQLRMLTEGDEEPESNGRYPKAPETTLHDVEVWVVSFMQETLERRASNARRWCPKWYLHTEVLTRFRLLYETYRVIEREYDAISMSRWFLDHLDPHLDVVFSEDGPFAACSPERHAPHRGLTIARNENAEADWGPVPAHLRDYPSPASTTV